MDGVTTTPPPVIPGDAPRLVVLTRDRPGDALVEAGGTARWGAPLWPRVEGVAAGTEVTLRARAAGQSAWATYVAGEGGSVDVTTSSASAGTYTGVEPDGLLWSLEAGDAADDLAPEVFEVVAEIEGEALPPIRVERSFLADGTTVATVEGADIAAELWLPRGAGPHPALIAMGGSEGGIDGGRSYAQYWVGRGYAVLALAYHGYPETPDWLTEVPVEYFGRALAYVRAHPAIRADRVGVIGGSRGGEAALLIASTYDDVAAVVAEVPSGVAWGAPTEQGETSSWTSAGMPMGFVRSRGGPEQHPLRDGRPAWTFTPMFERSLAGASAMERVGATFRVERSKAPILIIAGADDQIWPSCALGRISYDRLVAAGRTGDAFHCYENAGHWMGIPMMSTRGYDAYYDPAYEGWLAVGGTIAGIGRAQRDSTDREIEFLARTLGGG